jgi:xanthine dehydrogenase accessory factor
MSKELTVLVCGIGEEASAVARGLFHEGYAVALYRSTSPVILRRRMSFADAWFDGYAALDGVEARRADVNAEFLLGLQTHAFIPLLRGQFSDVVTRWPWHVIVAAREDKEEEFDSLRGLAAYAVGLGQGFTPGLDCDAAIATHGPDPGAILREGDAMPAERPSAGEEAGGILVTAPASGLFRTEKSIGVSVEPDATVGFIGETPVRATACGRIKGMARREQAVAEGAPIVEIVENLTAQVAGVSRRNQQIARSVAFAIEMENEGVTPFSFQDWR